MTDRSVGPTKAEQQPTRPGQRLARAERGLLTRVFNRFDAAILAAVAHTSVLPEFLGALTVNESGGEAKARRFEPGVYAHLKALAGGKSPHFNGLRAADVAREVDEMLHPKATDYHAAHLGPGFIIQGAVEGAGEGTAERAAEPVAGGHAGPGAVDSLEDEALRELATSWGLTQIMGYHMVGRRGTVRDLAQPEFHYGVAAELLVEFAARFELDLSRQWAEMFRCWNTGSPYGVTFDAHYVENGLRRMEIYRQLAVAAAGARSLAPAATNVRDLKSQI